jgi:hypothetical protein
MSMGESLSVGLRLQDGFGEERNDSISAGFRSSFKLDHVFQIAVLDDKVRFAGDVRLSANFPTGVSEKIHELVFIGSFGFGYFRHFVMAMIVVMAEIVKAMKQIMAKNIHL